MKVEIIETPSLGNRGYLIHDGSAAIAVDVQRDYVRWTQSAKNAGVTISHVFETHMHNDYVTGGYQLAHKVSAQYIIPENSGQKFISIEAADGQEFTIGALTVTAIHTPGHTSHHTSYSVTDGKKIVVCSGGALLYGTVGRTDLVSSEQTQELTAAQYDSAHKLIDILPEETALYPTHGFGSFCSSAAGSNASDSTLGSEKNINVALTQDKEAFIESIIEGLGPYPKYYTYMNARNQNGPDAVRDVHIHDYDQEAIAKILASDNSWAIDTRSRTAFSAKHPEGALGIELGNSFATYTGWVVPWKDAILLIGEDETSIRTAYEELSRIGMDSFVQGASLNTDSYFASAALKEYTVRSFSDLKQARDLKEEILVVDVRLLSDWNDSHINGSITMPLHEIMQRSGELPTDKDIWIHCASGYRASIAASLIEKSGRTPVLIDDAYESATTLQLTIKGG